jgi:hypothetical protein
VFGELLAEDLLERSAGSGVPLNSPTKEKSRTGFSASGDSGSGVHRHEGTMPSGREASRQCIAGGGYAARNACAALERQRDPHPQGPIGGRAGMPMTLPVPSKIFTIFEGTSEIRRMLIGRTITGLDFR